MFNSTFNEPKSRADGLQLIAVAGLMLVGVLFVYSATMVNAPSGVWQQFRELPFRQFVGWMFGQFFFKQVIWYGVGIAAAVAVCMVDYHTLARWSYVGYWGVIVLLVAVLIPFIGVDHGSGARRWIDLGAFQCQPSEFAKLGFILAMSNFLSRPPDELRSPVIFWKALGMMALPFVLVMKEPDLGSALVLIPSGIVMLFVGGVPKKFLVQIGATITVLAAIFLVDILFAPPNWQIKLEEYQRQRLMVYFGKDFAPANASPREKERLRKLQWEKSYQSRQALISVGSGGLTGKGWLKGDQTALGFLPLGAAHNDFIFSVIAEEEGFVGSVIVITLYAAVLFTGIRIASQARDRLGKLLAVGVVTLLFSHIFINIGMNIRIMPVTGIPLPLLSYGGSSVLCSLIAIGLMQNVHIHRKGY